LNTTGTQLKTKKHEEHTRKNLSTILAFGLILITGLFAQTNSPSKTNYTGNRFKSKRTQES
jgi:hypothetical protein